MVIIQRLAICGTFVLVLAGACTGEPRDSWENPNLPFEQWTRDRAECHQLAQERAEDEFALSGGQSTITGPGPGSFYSRTAPFQQSMNRFEASRVADETFERCMTTRGYRPVPRAN